VVDTVRLKIITLKYYLPLLLPLAALLVVLLLQPPPGMNQCKWAGVGFSGGLWIVGYGLLRWAEKSNPRVLMGALVGGILFRMVMVLLSLFFVRAFTELDLIKYVISLMIFYLACEFALVLDYVIRK